MRTATTAITLLLSLCTSSVWAGHHANVRAHHKHLARTSKAEPMFNNFDHRFLPDDGALRSSSGSKKKRNSQKCAAKFASTSAPAAAASSPAAEPANVNNVATNPSQNSASRVDQIRDMYAFAGYVYSLESCPSQSQATSAFKAMKATNARAAITFGYCQGQDTKSYYASIINAASDAGIKIMPLVFTLLVDGGSISGTVIPRMNKIADAIISNPDPVLAIALGDEPLYDNDFGSASALSGHVSDLRGKFKAAGLDIPISISEMAYGWQQADDAGRKELANNLDFFMVNNFPYFAGNAGWGGDAGAFKSFKGDISYHQSIANGKPILVTQTGWASNKAQFAPNSAAIQATPSSQAAYWNLLDNHCNDYFKANNIGWMWRDWDDTIVGWGINSQGLKAKAYC